MDGKMAYALLKTCKPQPETNPPIVLPLLFSLWKGPNSDEAS